MDELHTLLQHNTAVLLSVTGLFGLLVGSFLNVVIYRLPIILEREWQEECEAILGLDKTGARAEEKRLSLAQPGSHCPHCGHPIRFYENIPLISYLLQMGRCRHCGAGIGLRYPLVELLTAALSVLVIYHFGYTWQGAAALTLTWALIALTFIDLDHQLLPDVITLPFLWYGLILSTGSLFVSSIESIIGAATGYLLLWLIYQLFKLATGKEGMGFGDFKLLALLGAWMGWKMLPVIILLSSLTGVIIGVLMIALRKHQRENPIPFGPYLAIAGFVALLWGDAIIDWYLQLVI